MSGLKCVAEDPRFWIDFAEKFDDGEHENDYMWRLATDWLAMHDLLKDLKDVYGTGHLDGCSSETSYALGCDCGANNLLDKIRALIGGE